MIRDGDIIDIDIENGSLNLRIDEKELAERMKNFKPLEKEVSGYLKRYRDQVTSASRGAIFKK